MTILLRGIVAALLLISTVGCSGEGDKPDAKSADLKPLQTTALDKSKEKNGSARADRSEDRSAGEKSAKKKFQAVDLGNDSESSAAAKVSSARMTGESRSRAIVEALQPFQVMLGKWRWITNRKFDGSNKSGEDLEWVWDFRHNRNQPSLTAKCTGHPYFDQIWLTYLPEQGKFRMTTEPVEGAARDFIGDWTKDGEPHEESDGKKMQRTYKLQLSQTAPQTGEQWQLVFQQLDNNQYLLTMTRRPQHGEQYGPLDVVRQQRSGTSFAVADSDNPGPKCIISGGLGSMTVTYKGKSYPVCCTGCAAAFNDDPERWLAKLAEKEKSKTEGE